MSNSDLLSTLQMYTLNAHFDRDDGCINQLKIILKSKDKNFKNLSTDCHIKLDKYLKSLETQLDKKVAISVMRSSILNHKY